MKMWWLLQNSLSIKTTEVNILSGWILWYVTYISKIFFFFFFKVNDSAMQTATPEAGTLCNSSDFP